MLQMANAPEREPGRPSTPTPGHFLPGRYEGLGRARPEGAAPAPCRVRRTPQPPSGFRGHDFGTSGCWQMAQGLAYLRCFFTPIPVSPHLPAGAVALTPHSMPRAVPPPERPNLVPQALSTSGASRHRFPLFCFPRTRTSDFAHRPQMPRGLGRPHRRGLRCPLLYPVVRGASDDSQESTFRACKAPIPPLA